MQAEMLDLEDFSEIDSFKTLMKTTIDLASDQQDIHKNQHGVKSINLLDTYKNRRSHLRCSFQVKHRA